MKVRKLAVALALTGGLGSGVAQALGLGEVELQSFLNEPLDAEIDLRKSEGISPGDVFVNIAPQSAFERVGIERSFFLTKLKFQVTTAPDGNLVVNVSTQEPLREPYLNFLVEVTWPNGRLMREYAILVDPPVYAEESGMQEQVSAPATQQASQPQSRQPAPAQPARSTSPTRTSGARTLGPTNSADTLWTIAAKVRPDNSVTMQQTMLAIQDLNPDAFISGNINRLKQGEILRIPDESQIRSRSRAQAIREVAAQNDQLSTTTRTVDAAAGSAADRGPGETAGGSNGDQLRLIAADDSSPREGAEAGSAGGGGDTDGGVDEGTAVAMEELESARRENDELSGRVDDLQEQVETLQRLLELKNNQLAEMQSAQAEPAASDSEAAVAPESGAVADATAADTASTTAEGAAGEQEMASDAAAAEQAEAEAGAAPAAEQPDSGAEQPVSVAEQQATSTEQPDSAAAAPAGEQSAPSQKPFPGNIIDAVLNNPLYQIALGGGLIVLLLLLLLLARRNSNREKAFYDELNSETDTDETDSFDLSFDDDEDNSPVAADDDAMAEADAYIAYGRNDQAAHTLETAISREPSRTDLRLKLLGVYADIQDRESFDKQFREIEALDDDAVTAEAASIKARLEETESMPSIDDLESQLRSGGTDQTDQADPEPEEFDPGLADADSEARSFEETLEDTSGGEPEADDDDLSEYDFSDFELDDAESSESGQAEESEESDDSFEYTLDELDTDSDEFEFDEDDDLSLDVESLETELEGDDGVPADTASAATAESPAEADSKEPVTEAEEPDSSELDDGGELDESFFDELDAELDKVASEEDESTEDAGESELDDLELDISDEDLALMEEFSESDEDSPSDQPESDDDEEEVLPPVASDKIAGDDADLDEADLGDEDDFDFLSGTDEAATKLDLARAYVEMGDVDGARDILEEVALEGSDQQKAEAQDLLKNLS